MLADLENGLKSSFLKKSLNPLVSTPKSSGLALKGEISFCYVADLLSFCKSSTIILGLFYLDLVVLTVSPWKDPILFGGFYPPVLFAWLFWYCLKAEKD